MTPYSTTDDLRSDWKALIEREPDLRARDAADGLGVSEAELVAAECGVTSTRLGDNWGDLLLDLEGLGEVMALTRNDAFVHEKVGRYTDARVFPDHHMGRTLGEDIDLRIFFNHWSFGFAVQIETPTGTRRSLQFFDEYGTAVHKTHLRDESAVEHFDHMVETYRHNAPAGGIEPEPGPQKKETTTDREVDVDALRDAWSGLTDTHDFIFLLRDFGVDRQQAFRLVGTDFARPAAPDDLRTVLEGASAAKLPIMIFVGNRGCLQIHTGPIHRLKEARGWYNVLDPGFSLHVKMEKVASAWVVRKPVENDEVHSVEFFDERGDVVCYLFGERKEGRTERSSWRELVAGIG
ncbi:MAG: ChuX/HutX family heme-like substrate-binding protein [Rhodothermales bacterium]